MWRLGRYPFLALREGATSTVRESRTEVVGMLDSVDAEISQHTTPRGPNW